MRDLPWREEFDAAYCAGSSFGYLDDAGNAEFLAAVSRTLAPGGRFFIDCKAAESILPSFRESYEMTLGDIRFASVNRYDPATGTMENLYTISRGDRVEEKRALTRIYSTSEILAAPVARRVRRLRDLRLRRGRAVPTRVAEALRRREEGSGRRRSDSRLTKKVVASVPVPIGYAPRFQYSRFIRKSFAIASRIEESMNVLSRSSFGVALLFAILAGTPVYAVSPDIVISQVYGGGGNSGATYTHDYIELFNRGTTTVSVTGWSVQYTSAAGTGNFGSATNLITPLSGSLAPGQYLLVQEATNAAVGSPLPTPDVTDSTPINMSGTAGKVALVNTTTPLGCNGGSTPCSAAALATIVDLVGYGSTANFFEGSGPAPTISATLAAFRAADGCTDTDNNAADFTAATPAARNSASPLDPCQGDAAPSITSKSPDNGASGVAVSSNVSITFSEPVNVTGTWYLDLLRHERLARRDGDRRPVGVHDRSGRPVRDGRVVHGDRLRRPGLRSGRGRPARRPFRKPFVDVRDCRSDWLRPSRQIARSRKCRAAETRPRSPTRSSGSRGS